MKPRKWPPRFNPRARLSLWADYRILPLITRLANGSLLAWFEDEMSYGYAERRLMNLQVNQIHAKVMRIRDEGAEPL